MPSAAEGRKRVPADLRAQEPSHERPVTMICAALRGRRGLPCARADAASLRTRSSVPGAYYDAQPATYMMPRERGHDTSADMRLRREAARARHLWQSSRSLISQLAAAHELS